MKKTGLILGLAAAGYAAMIGLRFASCYLHDVELQSDLKFVAAQVGARIGLDSPSTDQDLRNAVIREAKRYGIRLEGYQVTVQRSGPAEAPVVDLAADYVAHVNVMGHSFSLHFTPSSRHR